MNNKVTTEGFIKRSVIIHGNRYDYSNSVYVSYNKRVEIICKIHGSFFQRVDVHLDGSGCKKCIKPHRLTHRVDVSKQITPIGSKPIALTNGKFAIVDEDDYDRVSNYNWHISGNGYAKGHINGFLTLMHRFVMGITDPTIHIDHIFHNKLDNRKSQLRLCVNSQNHMNQRPQKGKSSKYKGVSFSKARRMWIANINYNRKMYNLGGFHDEKDAALTYNKKAKEIFGDYAYLNIIESTTPSNNMDDKIDL